MKFLILIGFLMGSLAEAREQRSGNPTFTTRAKNCDLSSIYLRKANLTKVSLRKANLIKVNMDDTDFSYADLEGADFTGSNLMRILALGTNLRGANLRADLRGAKLLGANLSRATLKGADLGGAILLKAKLPNISELLKANLRGAVFSPNQHSEVLRKKGAIIAPVNPNDSYLVDKLKLNYREASMLKRINWEEWWKGKN